MYSVDDETDDVAIARKIVEIQTARYNSALALWNDKAESAEGVDLAALDMLRAGLDLADRLAKRGPPRTTFGSE